MRVKDAFDVIEKSTSPKGITLERLGSTQIQLTLQVSKRANNYVFFGKVLLVILTALGLFAFGYFLRVESMFSLVFSYVMGLLLLRGVWKKLRAHKRAFYYTQLVLDLSAKGGELHQYYKNKKGVPAASFKWFEVHSLLIKETPPLPNKATTYYLHLTSKKTANIDLFKEGISKVQVVYLARLLQALLQQKNIGEVPSDWQQAIPVLEEPIWVDLSNHLID